MPNQYKNRKENMKHQHNKGKIQDNAIKALVRSNLFRYRTEKPKKGKGSYNRQAMKKATSNGGFYFVIKNSLTTIVLKKIKNMI